MERMTQSPAFFTAFSRGLRGRCPHCGEGRLFRSYLKVQSDCPGCGVDLTRYPADDGPAYFTILLVGHLVIVPILFIPYVWQGPPVITVPLVLTPLALVTLGLGRAAHRRPGLTAAPGARGRRRKASAPPNPRAASSSRTVAGA